MQDEFIRHQVAMGSIAATSDRQLFAELEKDND
jgi:hypothetical protein